MKVIEAYLPCEILILKYTLYGKKKESRLLNSFSRKLEQNNNVL